MPKVNALVTDRAQSVPGEAVDCHLPSGSATLSMSGVPETYDTGAQTLGGSTGAGIASSSPVRSVNVF
jgi:hypothetical protein